MKQHLKSLGEELRRARGTTGVTNSDLEKGHAKLALGGQLAFEPTKIDTGMLKQKLDLALSASVSAANVTSRRKC